jgi:hypothetical protein
VKIFGCKNDAIPCHAARLSGHGFLQLSFSSNTPGHRLGNNSVTFSREKKAVVPLFCLPFSNLLRVLLALNRSA